MERPCLPGFSQLHSNLPTFLSISYFRMTFKTSLPQNVSLSTPFLDHKLERNTATKTSAGNSKLFARGLIIPVLCFCDFVPPKCLLRCSQNPPRTLGDYKEGTHLIPTWPLSLPYAGPPALPHEPVGMSLGSLEGAGKLGSECHFLHLQNIYAQSLNCALYPIK